MTSEGRNSGARGDVSAATDTQATREELLGTMLSIRSVQRGYKEYFS
jgi:hypothetical protein